MKALIIYDCDPDGLMAAAAVAAGLRKDGVAADDIKFDRAVRYQEPNFEKITKDVSVYIVDFNYNAKITEQLCYLARSVVVIDHHKTAREELEGIDCRNLNLFIDEGHSACILAWSFMNPGVLSSNAPLLLHYIEDMDLWQWKLNDSEIIAAAISCEDTNIETYQALYNQETEDSLVASAVIANLKSKGIAILSYQNKTIKILEKQTVYMVIGGIKVKAVNCADPSLVSFLGNRLAVGEPFAATFYMQPSGKWKFSIRSITNDTNPRGIAVDEIAKIYKGGGHPNASGFKIDELFPFEVIKGAQVDR